MLQSIRGLCEEPAYYFSREFDAKFDPLLCVFTSCTFSGSCSSNEVKGRSHDIPVLEI